MKKLKSLEKILLILAVIAVICGISTTNYATGDVNELFTTNPEQIPIKNTQQPENNQNTENNNANTNANNNNANTNTNTNSTSLPKTGVDDTGIWILAGACVIVAVYTYKKVRDYNV